MENQIEKTDAQCHQGISRFLQRKGYLYDYTKDCQNYKQFESVFREHYQEEYNYKNKPMTKTLMAPILKTTGGFLINLGQKIQSSSKLFFNGQFVAITKKES